MYIKLHTDYGIPQNISMEEFNNANDEINKIKIAERVLVSTERTDMFKPQEAVSVRVNYADIIGKNVHDALVTVDFGPKATIMAVFTPIDNGYQYVGEVGYFYDVDNITFLRPESSPADIITFREKNNQSIGEMENSSFIRGYAYKDGKFVNVINIDENIEVWWNDEANGVTDNAKWNRITQTSVIKYSDNGNTIDAAKTQVYSTVPPTANDMKPEDSAFMEQNRRVIDEIFTWSDDWQTYIVSEKTENFTGENVTVLKDFGALPYTLTGDLFNRYRILRGDGSVDIVDYEELSEIPQ